MAPTHGGLAGRPRLLRHVPGLTLALFLLPIGAGLVGTLLPAFGYLPALGGTTLSLQPWVDLFAAAGIGRSLWLTVSTGLAATALSLVIVVLFCAAAHDTRLFGRVREALAPLVALPHVAVAIGLAFLVTPSGWLVRLVSPWLTGFERPPDYLLVGDPAGLALILAMVVKEVPFLLLMTIGALGQVRAPATLSIARSLGYGPIVAWLKTVLPQVYGQIRLPVYAVLAFSLSVVDMAIVLAPGAPAPLAVQVFRWFRDPDLSLQFLAAAGAVLQVAIVVAAIGLWALAERLVAALGRAWVAGGWRGHDRLWTRVLGTAPLLIACALNVASIAGMALWSVAWRWRYPDALPSRWTFATWDRHLGALAWPTLVTLLAGLAAAAMALALVLGCLENEQRRGLSVSQRALWLLYLPLLVPQIGFLFGVQVVLAWAGLDGTWGALIWAHLLFVLPYVFLALADPYRAFDERFARTGLCLGASPARVFWTVKTPMLLRSIMLALAVGFAVSVALYLPTIFAGGGRLPTLTTEAVALAGGGDRRVLGVYALMQAVLPLLLFLGALGLPAWLYRNRRALQVA